LGNSSDSISGQSVEKPARGLYSGDSLSADAAMYIRFAFSRHSRGLPPSTCCMMNDFRQYSPSSRYKLPLSADSSCRISSSICARSSAVYLLAIRLACVSSYDLLTASSSCFHISYHHQTGSSGNGYDRRRRSGPSPGWPVFPVPGTDH